MKILSTCDSSLILGLNGKATHSECEIFPASLYFSSWWRLAHWKIWTGFCIFMLRRSFRGSSRKRKEVVHHSFVCDTDKSKGTRKKGFFNKRNHDLRTWHFPSQWADSCKIVMRNVQCNNPFSNDKCIVCQLKALSYSLQYLMVDIEKEIVTIFNDSTLKYLEFCACGINRQFSSNISWIFKRVGFL